MAAPAPCDAKRPHPAALEARGSTIQLPGLDIHSVYLARVASSSWVPARRCTSRETLAHGGLSGRQGRRGALPRHIWASVGARRLRARVRHSQPQRAAGVAARPSGRVTMVVGSLEGGNAGMGCADATGTAARFYGPRAVAVDGNNAGLVADACNHRLQKISSESGVVTTVAGHAEAGKMDWTAHRPLQRALLADD